MSTYSFFNVIKRQAKVLSRSTGAPLSEAQEQIAAKSGFSNFHELVKVAQSQPDDSRLMIAALGSTQLADALYEDPILGEFEWWIDDMMSDSIASTNANGFVVDDLEVTSATFDETDGSLTLEVAFQYVGEQDPDRMYHGHVFFIEATVRLLRRDGTWLLEERGKPIEITGGERDVERDDFTADYDPEPPP